MNNSLLYLALEKIPKPKKGRFEMQVFYSEYVQFRGSFPFPQGLFLLYLYKSPALYSRLCLERFIQDDN